MTRYNDCITNTYTYRNTRMHTHAHTEMDKSMALGEIADLSNDKCHKELFSYLQTDEQVRPRVVPYYLP